MRTTEERVTYSLAAYYFWPEDSAAYKRSQCEGHRGVKDIGDGLTLKYDGLVVTVFFVV